MKVLALGNCPLDRFLGSGKTQLMWTSGLRALGHEVRVLEPKEFEWAPKMQRARKFRQAYGAWRTLQGIDIESFDLIEFYGDEFWLATWFLRQRRNRPLLVAHTNGLELLATERARDYTRREDGTWWQRLFSKCTHEQFSPIAFRSADALVALCRLDCDYIVKHKILPRQRTALIAPGVDDAFSNFGSDFNRASKLAYFGSWTPRKGLQEIQEVVTRILLQRPSLHFDIIGASNSEAEIRRLFPKELQFRITVHPKLSNSDVAAELAACKIIFFPSLYEGFGMALAEAMACGCAAVTTPTGFGAELEDGEEALICPFGDVAAMQKAVERLLDDEALRRRIAEAGQRRARTLRWETSVARLEETYLRWIEEDRQARPRSQ